MADPISKESLLQRIYSVWKQHRMMRLYPPQFVCKKGATRICIEGYSRSGNSFAVRMFRVANNVHIAHHTHSTGNVKLALGYGIPVLILIRNPMDAIASACIYQKRSVDHEISRWISFYRYIIRIRSRVVLADFEVVIDNFNLIIDSVNSKYGTDFNLIKDLAAAEEQVFKDIMEWATVRGDGFDKIPIPTAEREPAKAKHRSLLSQHPRISVAQDLYSRLNEC